MSLLWRKKENKCIASWARNECESSNVWTSGPFQIPNCPLQCVEYDLAIPLGFQVHGHVVTFTWVLTCTLYFFRGSPMSFLPTRWCDIQLVENLGNETFGKRLTRQARIARDEEMHNIDHFVGFVELVPSRSHRSNRLGIRSFHSNTVFLYLYTLSRIKQYVFFIYKAFCFL